MFENIVNGGDGRRKHSKSTFGFHVCVHTHTQMHMQKHSIIWGKYADISNLI